MQRNYQNPKKVRLVSNVEQKDIVQKIVRQRKEEDRIVMLAAKLQSGDRYVQFKPAARNEKLHNPGRIINHLTIVTHAGSEKWERKIG